MACSRRAKPLSRVNLLRAAAVPHTSRPLESERGLRRFDKRGLDGSDSAHPQPGGIDVTRTTYALALLVALGALVLAGCGGGSGGTTSASGYGGSEQTASGSSEGEMTL